MSPAADALPLFAWLSPSFPVGAYAYSHGLEAAFEAGDVADAGSLREWIADLLAHGGARNDAILLREAFLAAGEGGAERMREANELALALAPSGERRLETRAQGDAFVAVVRAAWPCAAVEALAEAAPEGCAYPVALGAAAAGHGLCLDATLAAFLLAFVANLISAATRLGVVGQTDAQRVAAFLMDDVRVAASACASAPLDDLGGFAPRADVASMRHETLYSRLFRS
jgi:urease accessory protein